MAIRHDAKLWTVQEQIIEDKLKEFTVQFEVMPDGTPLLRIFSDKLMFGNRELIFNIKGELAGFGGNFNGSRPAWLINVEDLRK